MPTQLAYKIVQWFGKQPDAYGYEWLATGVDELLEPNRVLLREFIESSRAWGGISIDDHIAGELNDLIIRAEEAME